MGQYLVKCDLFLDVGLEDAPNSWMGFLSLFSQFGGLVVIIRAS